MERDTVRPIRKKNGSQKGTGASKPRGYWTQERVFTEGRKHKNRRTWQLAQSRSYNIARENGWLDEIIGRDIVHGKWTKDAVLASGKKFSTKTEWRNSPEGSAYVIAKRNGWLAEIGHFASELSLGERTILKWLIQRELKITKEKTFPDLRDKYPLRFDFWVPNKETLIEYHGRQHKLGWSGSEDDAREIQRRDRKKALYAKSKGIRLIEINEASEAEIDGILSEAFGNIPPRQLSKDELRKIKNLGGWDKERALADAKKYTSRKEWGDASHGYAYARLNGFLEEACAHMERQHAWSKTRKKLWTKTSVLKDAKKYRTKQDWRLGSPSAYTTSKRNGWYEESTAHMTRKVAAPRKWTKEAVVRDARKYITKLNWMRNSQSAYVTSLRNGWHDAATQHMKSSRRA